MGAKELNLLQFSIAYGLLLIVLIIMKKCKINQTKLLLISSIRMTVQLVLAGLVLTYIFAHPHPLFTIAYILVMTAFAIFRIISKNKWLNTTFRWIIVGALGLTGVIMVSFFVGIIIGASVFDPQYMIPLSGMIFGNAMTGMNLALKTFHEDVSSHKFQINTLLNFAVTPQKILLPFINNALETALLPTLNSMLGMGIISLPGMMTGQILSGTLPTTAILYQIAIMLCMCATICLTVFISLHFGYKTLYDKHNRFKLV